MLAEVITHYTPADAFTAFVFVTIPAGLTVLRAYVRANLTPQKLEHASQLADLAVHGAEEWARGANAKGGQVSGADKYAKASASLRASARRLGLKLTDDEVGALVHAALGEMKANDATPQPPG